MPTGVFKRTKQHRRKISIAKSGNHVVTAFNQVYGNYKYQARKRNHRFELTKEQFRKIVRSDCFYCGRPPQQYQKYKGEKFIYNGVDRMDNNKGYILSNCVPACMQCNWAKMNFTIQEFMAWVKRVYEYSYDEDV